MPTDEIRNFCRVSDQVWTGGQPTEEQLRAAAADGVQVVINLATLDPRFSLPDEAGLVRRLGLEYHHLPVDWERPLASDYAAFVDVMRGLGGRRVLIHCAANYRVTAFFGLYGLQHLGWTEAEADRLRVPIWGNSRYPVWEAFIRDMKAEIASRLSLAPGEASG
jgi:protein tyrosine phosphatase (PTP) superfamily phosphohydrolase (DUF442 family)